MLRLNPEKLFLLGLLAAAIATRWSWPPKSWLFGISLILSAVLVYHTLGRTQSLKLVPVGLLLGALALPWPWLDALAQPVLIKVFIAGGIITLVLTIANVVSERYATKTNG